MSDELAKRFDQHLALAVRNDRDAYHSLRECGRFRFLSHDRPETDDPIEMAFNALCYLGLDDDGHWRHVPILIKAIIAFLRHETGIAADQHDLERLARSLQVTPVSSDELWRWFEGVYRSP